MRHLALILASVLATVAAGGVARAVEGPRQDDRIARVFKVDQEFRVERSATQLRNVITQQVDAVREEKADLAFAAVAPRLKEIFSTGENYLQFFRSQFPGIATGRIIVFGDLRETPFGMTQMVRISDNKGEPWLAFFLMDQVENEWRIANVVVVKMPSIEV